MIKRANRTVSIAGDVAFHAHPRFSRLGETMAEWVKGGRTREWKNVIFRYVARKYSSRENLLSGMGAWLGGGRWCLPRTFHAVHCSSNPFLAHGEFLEQTRNAGMELYHLHPLAGMAIRVELKRVIDLRDENLLGLLGISADEILTDNWPEEMNQGRESLCQALGRAVWQSGADALFAPSIVSHKFSGFNIILIRENADLLGSELIPLPED